MHLHASPRLQCKTTTDSVGFSHGPYPHRLTLSASPHTPSYPLRPRRRRPLGFGRALGFVDLVGLGLLLDLPLVPHDLQPQPCIEE